VHGSPGSRCRLISPDPEHALRSLDLVTSAPPGYERARQRRVGEVNRDGVVQHSAKPRRRHCPAVSPAVLIQPSRRGVTDGMHPRKSGSQLTRRWREQDSNPRSPVYRELAAPRARHDPRRHREPGTPIRSRRRARRAICSMPGAPFTWTEPALSSRSASDGFEHLAASFSPSRASFEICPGDRRPNEAPKFNSVGSALIGLLNDGREAELLTGDRVYLSPFRTER
jgi:hypothetical protein